MTKKNYFTFTCFYFIPFPHLTLNHIRAACRNVSANYKGAGKLCQLREHEVMVEGKYCYTKFASEYLRLQISTVHYITYGNILQSFQK